MTFGSGRRYLFVGRDGLGDRALGFTLGRFGCFLYWKPKA